MAMSAPGTVLACGRPLAPLVEQVAEGHPPVDLGHQAGCRHCREALAELEGIWSEVGELAREDVRARSDLVAAAMRRLRTEPREREPRPRSAPLARQPIATHGGGHALLESSFGSTRIAAGVLAAIAGRAALAIPAVRALVGERSAAGASHVELDGRSVAITLELEAELGPPLPALATAVRAAVLAEIVALAGLADVIVNVVVASVADPR